MNATTAFGASRLATWMLDAVMWPAPPAPSGIRKCDATVARVLAVLRHGRDGDADKATKRSDTLIDELPTQRRQILVAHLTSDPAMPLDLTILLMAQNVVFTDSHIADHSTLKASAADFPISAFRGAGSMTSQTIDHQRQRLDTS